MKASTAEHDEALLDALRALPSDARRDSAVLCASMRAISHYQRLLDRAGMRVCLLEHYDGNPVEAVKLGSYHRAKGLEFKRVFLPGHDTDGLADARAPQEQLPDTVRERRELSRSRLFVAMTRARDELWLGSVRRDPAG